MHGNGGKDELSQAELEAARLGFVQYLRRSGTSPQFISMHGEELFGQAALEYARKRAEGVRIENPPGWIIACARRRTMSQFEAEKGRPRVVSSEQSGPLADTPERSPEEALLNEERFRAVRTAVGALSTERRRLLALSYFEGFTVRQAAER
ncbi:MAG TPA: hypothetical protein VF832_12870, partial [Longimicrobiales bacterium]